MVFVWFLILALGIFVLIKSADYFTDHAERFGRAIGLPNFLIGILILAVGTSLPEFATSIISVLKGNTEFLSGSVLGSVIISIFLILGLAALCTRKKIAFGWDVIANDLPFIAVAVFLVTISLLDGVVVWQESIMFLLGYVIYVGFNYFIERREDAFGRVAKRWFHWKAFLFTILSLVLVVFSSHYVVVAAEALSIIFNLSTCIIGASLVAFGSALPELFVAISAFRRGKFDMALGDILGSVLFNIFIIYGVAGLIRPLTIAANMYLLFVIFLIFGIFLLWLMLVDKKLTKVEALLLVLTYVVFILKLFNVF